ncbi:hypothetical protein R6Q59_016227 [Mikania micrantha]
MQSHGKKGTRPLDTLLISKGGERSQEARNLDEIDLQNTVKWVDTRAKDSLISYKERVKKRYGDDASKQPLFDPDSWIQAVGGWKKGKVYGFSDMSDPHVVMTGTQSTPTNEQVQRLNEEITKLRQEKETERQEKEKERAEKLKMMEQIEENRNANAEMKEQIHLLLKNISKNRSN